MLIFGVTLLLRRHSVVVFPLVRPCCFPVCAALLDMVAGVAKSCFVFMIAGVATPHLFCVRGSLPEFFCCFALLRF